jgi:hypothetical protein
MKFLQPPVASSPYFPEHLSVFKYVYKGTSGLGMLQLNENDNYNTLWWLMVDWRVV